MQSWAPSPSRYVSSSSTTAQHTSFQAHSPKVPEDDLYDPPLDDADYHSADEPQSGAATPTMHSPMVPTRPPWRSRLHPQGVNQSFEFDHVEGAPPTRSTRPPTGSTTMTASEGAASSPLSDHSGAPRWVHSQCYHNSPP